MQFLLQAGRYTKSRNVRCTKVKREDLFVYYTGSFHPKEVMTKQQVIVVKLDIPL